MAKHILEVSGDNWSVELVSLTKIVKDENQNDVCVKNGELVYTIKISEHEKSGVCVKMFMQALTSMLSLFCVREPMGDVQKKDENNNNGDN